MTTFSQAKTAIDEIALRIKQDVNQLTNAQQTVNAVTNDLNLMTTVYGQIVADIDAMLVANPNDAALKNLKASKDLLVAEFTVDLTRATAMNSAIKSL